MKTLASRCALCGLLIVLTVVKNSASASEVNVKVPFLFAEDEKLVQSDLSEIPSSVELSQDAFLNAPLTRLDYMLINLEQMLAKNEAALLGVIAKQFGPYDSKTGLDQPEISHFARYSSEKGRIVLAYSVDNLGQPQRPMQGTCKKALDRLEVLAPQRLTGYQYHNSALGVLLRGKPEDYTPVLSKLAKTIVRRVSLHSVTNDGLFHHILTCQQVEDGGRVQFERISFDLRDRAPK